jgi:asparagine synthase (glutamine-hydrolysing)
VCGIAGVVLAAGRAPDRGVVEAMTASLLHRGPDASGIHVAPGVAFGHRRLSIVDLSPLSAQPMVTTAGQALTYNGEIYNWKSLRGDLEREGEAFCSAGDTEVLLLALRRWGTAALGRLEGMFAFGYWDASLRRLTLARDRFGEKPLYYAPIGADGRGGVVFASEMRAMLAHPDLHAARAIDEAAVAQFFLHEFVPAPRTILRGVHKLCAGEALTWTEEGGVVLERYYDPFVPSRRRTPISDADAVRELVRLTERATAARLDADVPVGVFLSGGLDSSLLAACAVRAHPRVNTFTVAFDDASFDESTHARRVAHHLGTTHVEHRISTGSLLDVVPGVLDFMDEPHSDSSLLPMTLLAREARREVTVALGGEGGDELLGGYPTFLLEQALSRVAPAPGWIGETVRRVARVLPVNAASFSLAFMARQLAQGIDAEGARRHASFLAPLLPADLARLAGPRLTPADLGLAFDATVASSVGVDTWFDVATAFYLKVYLGEGVLTKVDRATMRASLEGRAPLLDRKLAEFCLSLPPRMAIRGRTTKWLMREALRPLVPRFIVRRPKKGFGAPIGAWLRGPLRGLAEAALSTDGVAAGGWLDPKRVRAMLDEHVSGRRDHRKAVYTALVFEHWRQRWRC